VLVTISKVRRTTLFYIWIKHIILISSPKIGPNSDLQYNAPNPFLEHFTLNGFSSLLIKLIIKTLGSVKILSVERHSSTAKPIKILPIFAWMSASIALFHHILYGNHLPWSRLWKSCTWDPTSDLEEIHKALPTVFFTNCKIRAVHLSKAY
jgi:hypothetical protein